MTRCDAVNSINERDECAIFTYFDFFSHENALSNVTKEKSLL